jgi:hypothetical protein
MIMRAINNVRNIQEDEKYWTAYGGEYTDPNGEHLFLSNPEAATVTALYNLRTVELQFEFFCFAYLRYFSDNVIYLPGKYESLAAKRFEMLHKKFRSPWSGNAKHILPISPKSIHPFTDKGDLNLIQVEEDFNQYTNCSFVIYRGFLHDDPKLNSLLKEELSSLRK